MVEKKLDTPPITDVEVRKLDKPEPLTHEGKPVTLGGVPIYWDTEILPKKED